MDSLNVESLHIHFVVDETKPSKGRLPEKTEEHPDLWADEVEKVGKRQILEVSACGFYFFVAAKLCFF